MNGLRKVESARKPTSFRLLPLRSFFRIVRGPELVIESRRGEPWPVLETILQKIHEFSAAPARTSVGHQQVLTVLPPHDEHLLVLEITML